MFHSIRILWPWCSVSSKWFRKNCYHNGSTKWKYTAAIKIFLVCTKSSGVALGLANARTLGHAKFVNAPPPGLKRHTNTPQLARQWMRAPEMDWCIATKPQDLGRQWKIKDFTAIGCQQIHKNVISCIPIRNITAENWQISKCYITALNKNFPSKNFILT